MNQDPIYALVLIHSAPLPFQLPACGIRKQLRIALGPYTHMGDLEEAPDSYLRICPSSAIEVIWGAIHCMEDLTLQ